RRRLDPGEPLPRAALSPRLARPAVSAEPADYDLGLVGREAGSCGGTPRPLGGERRIQVLAAAAAPADHVAAGLGSRGPEERAAAVAPPDDPEPLEQLERRVDRRQGDSGEALTGLGEELLGADVAVAIAEQPVHDDPLGGRPQAPFAEQLGELRVVAGRGVEV